MKPTPEIPDSVSAFMAALTAATSASSAASSSDNSERRTPAEMRAAFEESFDLVTERMKPVLDAILLEVITKNSNGRVTPGERLDGVIAALTNMVGCLCAGYVKSLAGASDKRKAKTAAHLAFCANHVIKAHLDDALADDDENNA